MQYDNNQSGYISIEDFYKCVHTLNESLKIPSIDKDLKPIEGECISKEEYKDIFYQTDEKRKRLERQNEDLDRKVEQYRKETKEKYNEVISLRNKYQELVNKAIKYY